MSDAQGEVGVGVVTCLMTGGGWGPIMGNGHKGTLQTDRTERAITISAGGHYYQDYPILSPGRVIFSKYHSKFVLFNADL